MSWLLYGLLLLALAYGALALFAYLRGDGMLFPAPPSSYTALPGFLRIPSRDGTPIAAVHLPRDDARFTVLYFHGNGEDLGHVEERLRGLHERGFAVLAIDYRSYGLTPGQPSEKNVCEDAMAAFDYAVNQLGVPSTRLLLYGRSLGSGPAVHLAAQDKGVGLILEAAFVSAFRTVTNVALLPWDRFHNLGKMNRVRCPVLVIHGDRDRTVPISHGRRLFAAAREPKLALWLEGVGHNNVIEAAGERYWRAVDEFAKLVER
jgi:fermentation-respiration switch protein FrsA (DUF1100 family)